MFDCGAVCVILVTSSRVQVISVVRVLFKIIGVLKLISHLTHSA